MLSAVKNGIIQYNIFSCKGIVARKYTCAHNTENSVKIFKTR